MTIDTWISDAANATPNKPAILFKDQPTTYAQFANNIDKRAQALVSTGVKKGDRVAYYGLNHPTQFVLLFACARIGAIFVPLNWRLAEPEVASIVADCTPTVFFYDDNFEKQALALADTNAQFIGAPLEIKKSKLKKPEPSTATTDDAILLVYTSGSTGTPKGVVLSQKALIANARMSVDAHRLTPHDTALVVLPLFHVGGLNILPTPAFSIGATIVLHDKFSPEKACIDLESVTVAITVPTILQAMINCNHWDFMDFDGLKGISIGSTDVPVALIETVHKRNVSVIQIYGATETSPFAIYQNLDEARTTVGSIGRAGSDCEIRLVSDGKDVAIGEPGEIWVKGDNVLVEYWNDEALSQEMRQDGWFRTGDVAKIDEQGLYWFYDRIKHVIISGGENIYPTQIERILSQQPNIKEVAVVGIADEQWGEIPVAVVVTESALEPSDVLAPLQGQLAKYKHPKKVVFVDAIPRNAMGKVVADDVKSAINTA